MPTIATPTAPASPARDHSFESAAATFKALADPTRLKILAHLVRQDAGCCAPGEDVCACDLEAVTGLSQPTVSHHMKTLMNAGLVIGQKQGRWMYYRVDARGFERVASLLPEIGG